MRPLFLLFTSFFSFLSFSSYASSLTETFVYEKDVEGKSTLITWNLLEKESNIEIKGVGPGSTVLLSMKPEMHTQSFIYESKNKENHYKIYRKDQSLIASQVINGKETEKRLSVGNDLWIQEFNFSLKPFILSDRDSLNFYIVRPKNLDTHYMEASKKEKEEVEVKGKVYQALKVEITLTGFKKLFWKAELWYNQKNGELLKYQANEGPNTPITTLLLVSTAQEKHAFKDFFEDL